MIIVVRTDARGIDGLTRDYGVTKADLAKINDIDLSKVLEGVLIKVDIRDDVVHVVKPFESVETIAKAHGVTADYIREYNGIDRVFVGDRVYIEDKK